MLRKAAASDTPLALGSREIEDEDILFEEGVEDDSTLIMSIDDDLIELHTGLSRFATRDQNSVDSLGDARAVRQIPPQTPTTCSSKALSLTTRPAK